MFSTTLSKFGLLLTMMLCFNVSLDAQTCGHQDLLERIDDAARNKDVSILPEIYRENAEYHSADGVVSGLAAIQESANNFYKSFPDAEISYFDVICTNTRLITRWERTGTPPSSTHPLKITGITVYEILDGKVSKEWEEISSPSLLMQLEDELKAPHGDN